MKPPEQVKRELVSAWIAKAEEDLGVAEHLVRENTPYRATAAFHAQQAVEKLLKAILVKHQSEFPKTHDLGELVERVVRVNPSLAEPLRRASALNPYSVQARYPSDAPEVTEEEANDALALARRVRNAVMTSLSPPTGNDEA